jgi:hypothetical protein
MGAKTIDEYIETLGGDWRSQTVSELRDLVDDAAPGATGTIKWAQPVWESNGPFAYVKAFGRSVNIGFWRGVQLDDPGGILEGEGDRMKHLTLHEGDEIPSDALAAFVRQAVELNREHGSPARPRQGSAPSRP